MFKAKTMKEKNDRESSLDSQKKLASFEREIDLQKFDPDTLYNSYIKYAGENGGAPSLSPKL